MRRGPAGAFVVLLALAAGCASTIDVQRFAGQTPTDEELIARVLDDVHRGMENRRIYKVMAHVSREYLDSEGRDYEAIRSRIKSIFAAYRAIGITRARPLILAQGRRAQVVETFGAIAEPFAAQTNGSVQLHGKVTVTLEKVGDRWLVVSWGELRH